MATPLAPVPYHSPLLQLPGAVSATGIDAGTAWHYGDPMGEQRAAVSSVAVFDRSNRSIITVTGTDRLTWLHTLTSQFLSSMTDGQSTQALVLSPQGHVEHHFVDHRARRDRPTWTPNRVRVPGCWATWTACGSGRRWTSPTPLQRFGLLTLAGPKARTVAEQVLTSAAGSIDAVDAGRAVPLAAGGFVRPSDDGALDVLVPREQLAALATSPGDGRRRAGRQLGGRRAAHPHPPATVGRRHRRPHHSRTRCPGWPPPSTWRRAATAGRRLSPGCTTSAGRRAGW